MEPWAFGDVKYVLVVIIAVPNEIECCVFVLNDANMLHIVNNHHSYDLCIFVFQQGKIPRGIINFASDS